MIKALAVVGGVGLLAGVLLTVVSRFFAVPENETVKKVRACLPGANCGACGYKGCDDYASALAESGAKPNLCVPGGQDTANALADVLGVEAGAAKSVAAFVHCNGNCEATSKKAEYDGIVSCRAASMLYGGPDACRFGCIGLGDCASVCPADAICVRDGIARIDTERCLGCGLCSETCPKKLISMIPKQNSVAVMCHNKDKGADARKACKNACIGCKKCEKLCENGAVSVKENLAAIDYEKCTGCGACAEGCPTGALKNLIPTVKP